MDSWKGSLPALDACEAVAAGIRSVIPDALCEMAPMADGGEGTQNLLSDLRPGQLVVKNVQGPLAGQRIEDGYLMWPDSGEALIEMARCAGLPLLTESERNPMKTTTYGVGEWIADAMAHGVKEITLAVGGSATVDGGMGMAQALGWHFLDVDGHELGFGGAELLRLAKIIPPKQRSALKLRVMCDVTNPLLGEKGSAAVFGPQKGANAEQVRQLECGLTKMAARIQKDVGLDVRGLSGGGAAGGIAAAAVAFLGAELVSGVEEFIRVSEVSSKLQQADWVITGEGRVDGQSLDGKVLSGILTSCEGKAKVAVIAGSCQLTSEEIVNAGLSAAYTANDQNLPLEQALAQAAQLAENAGRRFATEQLAP